MGLAKYVVVILLLAYYIELEVCRTLVIFVEETPSFGWHPGATDMYYTL